MKKYFTLLLFLLITTLLFAQSNYQDVVYLKNGSIIRGVIIEQVPNKSIKIETADRNVFVYQIDEIEKLAREPYKGKRGSSINRTGLLSGYKGIVELGYQMGVDYYGLDRLKLNIINGYQINPYFSLGFGLGLRYYFDAEATTLIPIFADFRVNFMNNNISPYLSLGVGYSFNATNSFKDIGFLLNPTIGISIKVSDKSAMNVGIGYEMQKVRFYDYGSHLFRDMGSISFVVGISF